MQAGEKVYNWIIARLDEGKTVYAASYGHILKIQNKHRDMLRHDGAHCMIQNGKRFESLMFCKISAR